MLRSLASKVLRYGTRNYSVVQSKTAQRTPLITNIFSQTVAKRTYSTQSNHNERKLQHQQHQQQQRTYLHIHQYNKSWREKLQEPKYWIVVLIVCGGVVYYFLHRETVPVTGRKRFMNVSHAWEKKFGEQSLHEIKQQYNGKILPNLHPHTQLVKRIGKRLETVTGQTGFEWEYIVVDSDEVNAFCIPGGKVVVMTGLLNTLQTEGQLAAVLSHEFAHALLRHSAERLSMTQYLWPIGVFASYLFDSTTLVDLIMDMALVLPNSRAAEFEADVVGLFLMARACYDPEDAIHMQNQLDAVSKSEDGILSYISTHPSHNDRVAEIDAWKELAQKERVKFCALRSREAMPPIRRWYDGMPSTLTKAVASSTASA